MLALQISKEPERIRSTFCAAGSGGCVYDLCLKEAWVGSGVPHESLGFSMSLLLYGMPRVMASPGSCKIPDVIVIFISVVQGGCREVGVGAGMVTP